MVTTYDAQNKQKALKVLKLCTFPTIYDQHLYVIWWMLSLHVVNSYHLHTNTRPKIPSTCIL